MPPVSGKKTRKPEQSLWTKYTREVNIFFKRINRQEVLTYLVFVLIAAFFWVIQTASQENEAEYTIDFKVENQPSNIVFTTQIPEQFRVKIKDKNINLINYSYNNQLDSLAVDFNNYADANGNFRLSSAELQALLINELFSTTQITSVTPALIDARFAVAQGKVVPVVFSADISTAANYRSLAPQITPDSVLIHAPSAILDTITMIKTKYFEQHSCKDTLNLTMPLQLAVGVKSTPSRIKVMVPISRYVEKILNGLDINVTDVPNGLNLSVFPNKAAVSCLVDFYHYSEINAEDFFISVSYKSIKNAKQKTIPVDIISYAKPGLVDNIKLHTKEVEYIIEDVTNE